MLIGAGIGITPFASILQSIMYRWGPCPGLGLLRVPPPPNCGHRTQKLRPPAMLTFTLAGFRLGACYGAVGWGAWGLCAVCGVRGMPGGLQGCATRAGIA